MKLGIENKVALIAGGARGIGRGIAGSLAAEGCRVVIASLHEEFMSKAVAEVRASGATVAGIAADCSTREGLQQVARFTETTFGPADIAVFNVDSGPKSSFLDSDDAMFEQAARNSVMAFTWFVRLVIPHMQEQHWGRILTVGSSALKQPHRGIGRAPTDTFRIGALALSKTLSAELGPFGITVNTLGPGGIATEQFRAGITKVAASQNKTYDEFIQGMLTGAPTPRMGTPEDMGAAAAFLCSDRAGYITGQLLLVDGGKSESLQ